MSEKWFYTKKVKEHFFKPKNFLRDKEAKKYRADGVGVVGDVHCGDVMKMWIKVEKKTDKIKECKWMCFGCASAIATTSILSGMVKGMKIEKALKIKPIDIIKNLGGLPVVKIHCSVLGDKALRTAINDYFRKTNQLKRIVKV